MSSSPLSPQRIRSKDNTAKGGTINKAASSNTPLSSEPLVSRIKSCKVVLEDILSKSVAEKPQTLKVSQDKNHSTLSRHTNDMEFLENLEARTPIAWPKMDDETSWFKLDGAVYCRLHNCCSLSDRVQLLSNNLPTSCSYFWTSTTKNQKSLRSQQTHQTLNRANPTKGSPFLSDQCHLYPRGTCRPA